MYNCINKLFIYFFCLVAINCSCRAKKESVEKLRVANQDQSRLETNTSWMGFGIRDSTLRYWSFTSDTSFYFNPDEGLWGQSGKVAYIERKSTEIKDVKLLTVYDSLGLSDSALERDRHSTWTRYIWSDWVWGLLLVVIVGAWLFWKIPKRGK